MIIPRVLALRPAAGRSPLGVGVTGHRVVRFLLFVVTALLAAYVAHSALGIFGDGVADSIVDKGLYNALLVGGTALCLARAWLVREERAAWLSLGTALGLWAAGDVYYTFFLWDADPIPYPSTADALWLAFYPATYIGLVLLVRPALADLRTGLWVDGLLGGLAAAALAAAVLFGTVVETTGGAPLAVATNLAYPLGDVLLLALAVAMLALRGWRLERRWLLIVGGIAAFLFSDTLYLYESAVGAYEEGTLTDVGWVAAMVIIAWAAWQPPRRSLAQVDSGRLLAFPAAFASIGLGLLVYDHVEELGTLAFALTGATLAVAIVRLWLSLRETRSLLGTSRRDALTDALTGLGNRRSLMAALDRVTAVATDERPFVVAVFDLDGFKSYNDSFGHPAGDALLARLGRRLADTVAGVGTAYRMGGDEFCVVASLAGGDTAAIVRRACAALEEEGDLFSVTCCAGWALLPSEVREPGEALRVADARMYARKQHARLSAGRQSGDVLVRLMQERDAALGSHLSDIAALAEALGKQLGLPAEELGPLRQAAELHDIGKSSIPDEILQKPGPLTTNERAFVQQHTLIGERILAAAPALDLAARLVRWSHERIDGAGYPDGLQGADIPLGARIIAVCDAFDAMTSDRPYRNAMSVAAAVAELRRSAGTQFDPEVVEAFCALARGSGKRLSLVA